MWQAVTNVETRENPLDAIRNNQNLPQSGGVLQGQSPSTKSESDSAWEAIVGASDKNVF